MAFIIILVVIGCIQAKSSNDLEGVHMEETDVHLLREGSSLCSIQLANIASLLQVLQKKNRDRREHIFFQIITDGNSSPWYLALLM